MQSFREKAEKKRLELSQAEEAASSPDNEEQTKRAKLDELIHEAQEQTKMKQDLEADLKRAREPQKALERRLQRVKQEIQKAEKNLEQADLRLKDRREQIMAQTGSAESEQRQRAEQLRAAEDELAKAQRKNDELKQAVSDSFRAYEELEPHVEQAKQNSAAASKRLHAVESKIYGLESSNGDSLAVFGPRCTKVKQMVRCMQYDVFVQYIEKISHTADKQVDSFLQKRRFKGPIMGPLGAYMKVVAGKEDFASIAEHALGTGTLDRFIVTNDHDRKLLQEIRSQASCQRDCGIFQVHASSRYNVPGPPVPGVETVASTLNISNDLVFNCLVDNCRIEERALAKSREESEQLLLNEDSNGRYSVRGKMKEVYCLPHGDHWSVRDGSLQIVGNEKALRQSIGLDRSAACRDELKELRLEESKMEHKHTDLQKDWNTKKRACRDNNKVIENLMSKIESLKAEHDSASNFDTDTSEFEQDIAEAQQQLEILKDQELAMKDEIEEKKPEIQALEKRLAEIKIRNEKVLQDMKSAEEDLGIYIQSQTQRDEKIEKRRQKVKQYEEILEKHEERAKKFKADVQKYLRAAKRLTYKRLLEEKEAFQHDGQEGHESQKSDSTQGPSDEELDAISIVDTDREPAYFEARITRTKKKIELERKRKDLSNELPAAAYQKYVRAKKTLENKLERIAEIEQTCEMLSADLQERKKRWRQFRSHIAKVTDMKFDRILNLKGSSGELDFRHKERTLQLVVQKDSADSNSQQKDVKALSGGERSFTTIALLLALGESLETPFRILDEFDVFLDPVTRKLTIEALIEMAKSMGHRQFIFITPQDISNVKTDPQLKILKLHPPARNNFAGLHSQQTLDFSQASN